MTKREFLTRLETGLKGLPQEDISERLAFYAEMIDDRMEEGLSEEEAVAEIGSVEEVVSRIVSETPLSGLIKERMKPKRRLTGLEITLIVLGFPVWFPLFMAAFVVLFSVYVVLWSLVVCLWAVGLSLAVSALACIVFGIFQNENGLIETEHFRDALHCFIRQRSGVPNDPCRVALPGPIGECVINENFGFHGNASGFFRTVS